MRVAVVHGSNFNETDNGLMELLQGVASQAEFFMMPVTEFDSESFGQIDGYIFVDQKELYGLASEFKLFFEQLYSNSKLNLESKVITAFSSNLSSENELKNLVTSLGAVWVGFETRKKIEGHFEQLGQRFAKITQALKTENLI